MNESQIAKLKDVGKFLELAGEGKEFQGIRLTRKGFEMKADVMLVDMGYENIAYRYYLIVTSEDGKSVSGNPTDSIETAILTTHWLELA